MTEKPVSNLGPYEVLQPLGSGGMGVVYRARHLETGELAAVKTVRVPHENLLAGLRREIHALARIRHPGIVRIVGEGLEDGLPWYAMELLEGATLRRFIGILGSSQTVPIAPLTQPASEAVPTATIAVTAQVPGESTNGALGANPPQVVISEGSVEMEPTTSSYPDLIPPLRPPTAPQGKAARGALPLVLSLVRRLCSPLAFLHGEGLVHRDLKPDNVFIKPDGTPVLMDFGLVSLFGGQISREVLETETSVLGTVAYMAPEQIRGELLDARADLYALGCILYELLTGQPPFPAPTVRETLEAHLRQAPLPPSELVLDVPEALEDLVLRLLAKSPRERFGYADDVSSILAEQGAEDPLESIAPRPRSYLYRPRLAGRAEALAVVENELVRLSVSAGGILLVGGESGVGKTRLAMEAARRAKRREMRVLTGECVAPGAPEAKTDAAPLQALRRPLQKIADWCREWGWERTERILGRHAKVLAVYEPALGRLDGNEILSAPTALPVDAARFRLFSALAEMLTALAAENPAPNKRAPLLLILDDLQWADDLTLGFLDFLLHAERIERMGLLILATYRSEEAGTALRQLLEDPRARRLQLERLDEKAVGFMVTDMLALRRAPTALVRYLTKHAEGNPFFVAEYLQTAVAEGLIYRDGEGHWQVAEPGNESATEEVYRSLPLPGSLRDLVGRRLQGLPEKARRLVEAAAVLGREANLLVAWAVSQLGDEDLLDALTELTGRQVLEASAPGRLRFIHEKLREVAYSELPLARQTAMHHAAAEAIETLLLLERDAHLAELGLHWERAGVADKARTAYLAAARRAVQNYAHAQAERMYRAYLTLVPQPTTESVNARLELSRDVLFLQGHNQGTLQELEQALVEARRVGNPEAEALGLLELGEVQRAAGTVGAALISLARALDLYQRQGDRRQQAEALSGIARVYASQGRREEARSTWVQAFAIHREVRNRKSEALTLTHLAELHMLEGVRIKEARILFKEALRIHQSAKDRIGEGVTLVNLATSLQAEGRVPEARECYQQALAIHREVGNRRYEAVTLCDSARLERQAAGEFEAAARLAVEAQKIAHEVQDPYGETACLCERGHIALARNEDARPFLQQAETLSRQAQAGPESEAGVQQARLRRAMEAAQSGKPLFRGERPDELPKGFRLWLEETKQLS